MTESKASTILEMAEVIADQNERIRNLTHELDAQNDIIVDYELDQEKEERVSAAIFADLKAISDEAERSFMKQGINRLLETYFKDFE